MLFCRLTAIELLHGLEASTSYYRLQTVVAREEVETRKITVLNENSFFYDRFEKSLSFLNV